MLTLDAPHRQPCGKYRQKAIGIQEQCNPVRQRDEPQREEFIQSHRLAMDAAQVEHELADPCATERTDAKSREHRPREINGQPAPAVRADARVSP